MTPGLGVLATKQDEASNLGRNAIIYRVHRCFGAKRRSSKFRVRVFIEIDTQLTQGEYFSVVFARVWACWAVKLGEKNKSIILVSHVSFLLCRDYFPRRMCEVNF